MNDTITVNFHCHSIFSDGEQTPEALVASLAAAGVRYAALTDHNSIEGLPRFQEALKKRGIASLTGVELTTWFEGREIHLLGYGFDPHHPDLAATLLSLRQVRDLEVHSITGSLRRMGTSRSRSPEDPPAVSAAPNGRLEIGEGIELIHRAGGRVFLAHPLVYEQDPEDLERCLALLKGMGLDGIEAFYAPFSESQRADLCRLARKHDLLICAGTDFHAQNGAVGGHTYGIGMPRQDWARFRAAFFSSPAFLEQENETRQPGAAAVSPFRSGEVPLAKPHHFRQRAYVLRIFLPTLIAITLFLGVIWGLILPSFEQTLLDRKRELIRELTNSAWSILASYERDESNGLLTREQAQALAAERIATLRYGPQGMDYFWIQDMQPQMIMHPYRSDLNGQDLSDFTDVRGVPIFVEFAELVRQDGEGYIDYVWQWNDDPERLEPKQSYVRGFDPWGWVIGTGIYIDDVRAEIARLERSLTNTSLAISGAVVLLLLFVLQQSLQIERQRQEVLDSLHESTERYHTLIEATTEGTLLILEGSCRYANPIFLGMTGYTSRQLEFLDLADLLPPGDENQAIWERFEHPESALLAEVETFEGVLRCADGRLLDCALALNRIVVAGQAGFILLARDTARQGALLDQEGILHAAQSVPLGIFRARAARRAALIESNAAARAFFDQDSPALADLFSDPGEFESILQTLQDGGAVTDHIIHIETSDAAARFLSLSARLVQDARGRATYIDGTLADVSAARKQKAGREALIERLQASLLFLHEPIARLGRDVLICDMHTSIAQLSRQMTTRNVTAALVESQGEAIIGIVTDHDLRARVLADDVSPGAQIHTIMSAPLTRIPEEALVYEALLLMEEKGVRHLAVEDRNGRVVSVVDNKSLLQFQRYAPIVLGREIARAATPDEVVQCTERVPLLAKALLDSSSRPRHVTTMLASVCDAATQRLIQLAIAELGPPPVPFAFIAMGSQGRQEQTLVTDQDNGIIFAPPGEADLPRAGEYFLELGRRVCAGLGRAGYTPCRGGVMAGNPRWCRSLPGWIQGFAEWVQKAEPQEIIDLSIFFDFRTVYGEAELTHELRRAIHAALEGKPVFLNYFAQNALLFKPPFRLLGSIYLGGGATEHSGEINLKDAMMPIVAFARLYALHHRIDQTHTLERIDALGERNVLSPASREEIAAAYDFLMQLRLRTQVAAIQAGRTPANLVHPGRLGTIQQELLKQAFAQIAAVQKKVSYDFLGGTGG